jgi:hypothetical protein
MHQQHLRHPQTTPKYNNAGKMFNKEILHLPPSPLSNALPLRTAPFLHRQRVQAGICALGTAFSKVHPPVRTVFFSSPRRPWGVSFMWGLTCDRAAPHS